MPIRLPIVTATAISAVLSLPVSAASFNARPGAWEMVLSTTIAGNPIPPETMAKMTPEKRALVEEALKARVSNPIAATYKVCITQEELDDAKRYMTGSYALRFDSSPHIAEQLLGIQIEELGIDYVDRRNGLVDAVGIEDVRRSAKRILRPAGLIITIVGQPEKIGSGG